MKRFAKPVTNPHLPREYSVEEPTPLTDQERQRQGTWGIVIRVALPVRKAVHHALGMEGALGRSVSISKGIESAMRRILFFAT